VDDNARNRIPEELKGALVLTLYEAKGLEFDDVLLYNLFKDSQVYINTFGHISAYINRTLTVTCSNKNID
jgi:superfamily I DNA/RNA helicase